MRVGVDETGRGSCFGPIVSCAVGFPASGVGKELLGQLTDSKKLSKGRREALFEPLRQAVVFAFGAASTGEVERLNPRGATLLSMRRAILRLPVIPSEILVDGLDCPPDLPCPAEAIVKGDLLIPEISAASILAKVFRDRLLERLSPRYPQYGIDRNAGYGTRGHFDAIVIHGASRHHRPSFLRKLTAATR